MNCTIPATKRTAIRRSRPSAPMVFLAEQNLLKGRQLDYGAGRGFDADFYHMEKYDPNYFPIKPKGKFDTITVNYVLNVLPLACEREVLCAVQDFLTPKGQAFISVRRDVKAAGKTGIGTYQRPVSLPLPVLKQETGKFTIYRLEKDAIKECGGK